MALSLYVENVVEYIAGYVVRMLQKEVKCPDRLAALQQRGTGGQLLRRKNRGGLLVPSSSVLAICKSAEKCLRRLEASNGTHTGLTGRLRLEAAVICAHSMISPKVESNCSESSMDTSSRPNHTIDTSLD
ncbi:unnamed protein product [Ixodes hexagonus]